MREVIFQVVQTQTSGDTENNRVVLQEKIIRNSSQKLAQTIAHLKLGQTIMV